MSGDSENHDAFAAEPPDAGRSSTACESRLDVEQLLRRNKALLEGTKNLYNKLWHHLNDCDVAIRRARAATLAERERCAKVIENMGRSNGRIRSNHKRIAAEIRAGNPRIGTLVADADSATIAASVGGRPAAPTGAA